jgi:hypothetical protein
MIMRFWLRSTQAEWRFARLVPPGGKRADERPSGHGRPAAGNEEELCEALAYLG